MDRKFFALGLTLLVLGQIYEAEASWLNDAMHSESRGRALRALEKKRLLNELEVEEDEQEREQELQELVQELRQELVQELEEERELQELEQEQELFGRSAEDEFFEELERLAAQQKKRDEVRMTPVPPIRRLKLTPPPGEALPGVIRLEGTPFPPSGRRATPVPGEIPGNVVNDPPIRVTPRPLRLTPVPENKPPVIIPGEIADRPLRLTPAPPPKRLTPVPLNARWEDLMWAKVIARREEQQLAREEERERRRLNQEYEDYRK